MVSVSFTKAGNAEKPTKIEMEKDKISLGHEDIKVSACGICVCVCV